MLIPTKEVKKEKSDATLDNSDAPESGDLGTLSEAPYKFQQNYREKRGEAWPPADYRKDPEEGYFTLTCLAVKIKLSNEDPDFMYHNVLTSELYHKCKESMIPFHTWYEWITNEFIEHDKMTNPRSKKDESDPEPEDNNPFEAAEE